MFDSLLKELKKQRLDDHRYYHQCRINQSLHLFSSLVFLTAFTLLFFNFSLGVLLAWIVAQCPRQIGHFFFEPKGYDELNKADQRTKEAIKPGFNLKRKLILLTTWASMPVVLLARPDFFGLFTPHSSSQTFLDNLAVLWLAVGIGAFVYRTIHLFFIGEEGVLSGVAWAVKILTDPIHDLKLYYKSPWHLIRGQRLDPMHEFLAEIEELNEDHELIGQAAG